MELLLRKASFPFLNKREEKLDYSEPLKGDKRAITLALLIIILYPPIFIISNHYPRITPSTPGEGIRKHTLFAKFYDQVKVLYDLHVRSQVVRNRGHGFSKRFITLQGCTTLPTRVNRFLVPVH